MGETILNPKKAKRVKIGMWILIIFGFFIVILTIWQYPKYLRAPFARYGQEAGLWKSSIEQQAEEITALKESDTDNDGLTDFDEMYIYGTSAYLADSDSDGFSDKEELESGNDPNCPAGKVCPKIDEGTATANAPEDNLNNLLGGEQSVLSGGATPDEIRNALRQAGVSDDMLSKIDDESLIELYQETLGEMGASGQGTNTNTDININTNTTNTNSSVTNVTAEQLREILRQNGVDEAILKSVDDATLMKIFEESVKY